MNWVDVDGDVVAVDSVDGTVHTIRGAAAVVWKLLDGEPLDGLEELISDAFGVSTARARHDIDRALAQLAESNVLAGEWYPRGV